MRFISAVATHIGLKRERQEDNYSIVPHLPAFGVFDGMGGHEDGDKASLLAAESFQRQFAGTTSAQSDLPQELPCALMEGHTAIRTTLAFSHYRAPGTTAAALLLHERKAWVSWAGDSRVYRLRGDSLHPLTQDHTTYRGHLTMCLGGPDAIIAPPFHPEQLEAGDIFLLCTDGLTKTNKVEEIVECLMPAHMMMLAEAERLQTVADQLIWAANSKGGPDNTTVIVVKLLEL